MYLLNDIMFSIVMAMSCDIVSYITCMFYFLCKTIVTIQINKFIYFGCIVSTISVNDIMLIKNNIINQKYNIFFTLRIIFILQLLKHQLNIA